MTNHTEYITSLESKIHYHRYKHKFLEDLFQKAHNRYAHLVTIDMFLNGNIEKNISHFGSKMKQLFMKPINLI